jgi:hypothetical protein
LACALPLDLFEQPGNCRLRRSQQNSIHSQLIQTDLDCRFRGNDAPRGPAFH